MLFWLAHTDATVEDDESIFVTEIGSSDNGTIRGSALDDL